MPSPEFKIRLANSKFGPPYQIYGDSTFGPSLVCESSVGSKTARCYQLQLRPLKFDLIKQNGIKIPEQVNIEIWYEKSSGQLENWSR